MVYLGCSDAVRTEGGSNTLALRCHVRLRAEEGHGKHNRYGSEQD